MGWKKETSDDIDDFYRQSGNNFSWDVLGLEGFLMCGLMDYFVVFSDSFLYEHISVEMRATHHLRLPLDAQGSLL